MPAALANIVQARDVTLKVRDPPYLALGHYSKGIHLIPSPCRLGAGGNVLLFSALETFLLEEC